MPRLRLTFFLTAGGIISGQTLGYSLILRETNALFSVVSMCVVIFCTCNPSFQEGLTYLISVLEYFSSLNR